MTEHAHPTIRVREAAKSFGATRALDAFSLDVWKGRLLTLLGPSGCGKTTALRIIAGFERLDAGTVEIEGRTVAGDDIYVPPERRNVGMVFQDYALFPHMTVVDNVAYGLARTAERRQRVHEVLSLVGLEEVEMRHPHELSGGQQQRVALARAIAPRPQVILFDEPFSNLDAALRDRVRRELRAILVEAEVTAVFVTHDQEEALAMSDIVAVMHGGRVLQAAPPDMLYRNPVDPWVAAFVGDADFLPGHASGAFVRTPLGSFPCELSGPARVMVRPESVVLTPDENGDAVVLGREYFGHDQLVTIRIDGDVILRARQGPWPVFEQGDRVDVRIDEVVVFPGGDDAGRPMERTMVGP